MLINFASFTLTLVLSFSAETTPRPGLWRVNSRLTGEGKIFGGSVPPLTAEIEQCITAELWATRPKTPPQCTMSKSEVGTPNHKEVNYSCERGLHVRAITDILSREAIRVETTQRFEIDGDIAQSTVLLNYTFISDSCGAVQPEEPSPLLR